MATSGYPSEDDRPALKARLCVAPSGGLVFPRLAGRASANWNGGTTPPLFAGHPTLLLAMSFHQEVDNLATGKNLLLDKGRGCRWLEAGGRSVSTGRLLPHATNDGQWPPRADMVPPIHDTELKAQLFPSQAGSSVAAAAASPGWAPASRSKQYAHAHHTTNTTTLTRPSNAKRAWPVPPRDWLRSAARQGSGDCKPKHRHKQHMGQTQGMDLSPQNIAPVRFRLRRATAAEASGLTQVVAANCDSPQRASTLPLATCARRNAHGNAGTSARMRARRTARSRTQKLGRSQGDRHSAPRRGPRSHTTQGPPEAGMACW